jgi:hypothetical protein
MALGAGAAFLPNSVSSGEVLGFRNCFPEAAAGVPWSDRLPRSMFAEAMMSVVRGEQPGILKARRMVGMEPAIRVILRFGPLVLFHLTFPSERNYSTWADLRWTAAIMPLGSLRGAQFEDVKDILRRRCHGKKFLARRAPDATEELSHRSSLDTARDWIATDDPEIHQGLSRGDIISLLLRSDDGDTAWGPNSGCCG